mgnify:CR=1 FL=1
MPPSYKVMKTDELKDKILYRMHVTVEVQIAIYTWQ